MMTTLLCLVHGAPSKETKVETAGKNKILDAADDESDEQSDELQRLITQLADSDEEEENEDSAESDSITSTPASSDQRNASDADSMENSDDILPKHSSSRPRLQIWIVLLFAAIIIFGFLLLLIIHCCCCFRNCRYFSFLTSKWRQVPKDEESGIIEVYVSAPDGADKKDGKANWAYPVTYPKRTSGAETNGVQNKLLFVREKDSRIVPILTTYQLGDVNEEDEEEQDPYRSTIIGGSNKSFL